MTPINLPKSLVIEKAREAYLAGRLSAQGPTPACDYRDVSGRPCVIGAAMSEEEAEGLRGTVCLLLARGEVRTNAPVFLGKLQNAHDDWAKSRRPSAEADLCRLLSLPIPQTQGGV